MANAASKAPAAAVAAVAACSAVAAVVFSHARKGAAAAAIDSDAGPAHRPPVIRAITAW